MHILETTTRTESLSLFRISLGVLMLIMLFASFPNWIRFTGPEGITPETVACSNDPLCFYSIFSLSTSEGFLWALYGIWVIAALCFTIGFFSKTATVTLFLLNAFFFQRHPSLINGQDQLIRMLLFFCCFTSLSEHYSVDRALRGTPSREVPAWPLWLMQSSLLLMYVFTGPFKWLRSIEWRDGTALYYVTLSDRWFRFPESEALREFLSIAAVSDTALLLEILFPYAYILPYVGQMFVFTMILFHGSITILLSPAVTYFNLATISALVLLIRPESIARVVNLLLGSSKRRAVGTALNKNGLIGT